MARELKPKKGKEYVFQQAKGGGAQKYPWDQWFATVGTIEEVYGKSKPPKELAGLPTDLKIGKLLILSRDSEDSKGDYDVPTGSMPNKLRDAARKRYMMVDIGRHDEDGQRLKDELIIRARDMTDEEREAEDLLRAEEKVALEEKKAEKKKVMEAGKAALASQGAA